MTQIETEFHEGFAKLETTGWQETEHRLTGRIANLIGSRTMALVQLDASFDPDMYDPAFDEDDFGQIAA